jgi:hypothetical protein
MILLPSIRDAIHLNWGNEKSEEQAVLKTFWREVGEIKRKELLRNSINSFIYEIIAKRYPNLTFSEQMVRFETIDQYPDIQDDVFKATYKYAARGDYKEDLQNITSVLKGMCGDYEIAARTAEYVNKVYVAKW